MLPLTTIAAALLAFAALLLGLHAARDRRALLAELRALRAQVRDLTDGLRRADHGPTDVVADDEVFPEEGVALEAEPDAPESQHSGRGRTVH